MAVSWVWIRIAVAVVVLGVLLGIVWGASMAPARPSPSIVNTRDAPAVVGTPRRSIDNEDD